MGGRGTFAAGRNVPFTYKTIGILDNVPILRGLGNQHNLPEERHSSNAYIKQYPNGTFQRYREYSPNGTIKFDIDYHIEPRITGNRDEMVLHIHFYTNGIRDRVGRRLTEDEYEKYKKYFGGVR